jgi:hypothetical protein
VLLLTSYSFFYPVLQLVVHFVRVWYICNSPLTWPSSNSSNYLNDAGNLKPYHMLMPTQLFFDITELVPAVALYSLLPRHALPNHNLLLCSMVISFTHLFLSLWDQGFAHILFAQGPMLRDATLATSDLLGLLCVGWIIRGRLKKDIWVLSFSTLSLLSLYLVIKGVAGYR